MLPPDNVVAIDSRNTKLKKISSSERATISSCRAISEKLIPDCFDFLSKLDDSLFKLAEKSQTSNEQQDYFALMRTFRVKQSDIKKEFAKLTLTDFDNFFSQQEFSIEEKASSQTTKELSGLSLMEKHDLEEDIAIKQIETKMEHVCKYELEQLNTRFAHILGLSSYETLNIPLSPEVLVHHLKEIITNITENIAAKLIIYKLFEQDAVGKFKELFQALNDELINNNILPKINFIGKPSKSKNKVSAGENDEISNDALAAEGDGEDAALFDELRRLFPTDSSRQSHQIGGGVQGGEADIKSLVSALSTLQHQSEAQTVPIDASNIDVSNIVLPDLRQTVMSNLSYTQEDGTVVSPVMSSLDEDTVNIIELLFEFVLEDRSVPAPIRALLSRLQLPMLKVALIDKSFFSKKNHVARLLLNNLAKVSTGWDYTNDPQDKLLKEVDFIVNSVLTEYETEVSLFDDLNQRLLEFMMQQDTSRYAREKRIAQSTEGKEKLIYAEQEADRTINELFALYSPVPNAVVTLVNDGWRQVLRINLLRTGKESTGWENAVTLLENLLWSVSPKENVEDRKKLLETIPELLKSLRTSLSGPSFNQHKITATFKELKNCHVLCLNDKPIAKNQLQPIDKLPESTFSMEKKFEPETPIAEEDKLISDDEALLKVKKLPVGTWLKVSEDKGDDVKHIKFSWRSNLTGVYLFVTFQGLKAAEVSTKELASWFQKGKAMVLDQIDVPLMDRALQSMKDTVEQQEQSKTS